MTKRILCISGVVLFSFSVGMAQQAVKNKDTVLRRFSLMERPHFTAQPTAFFCRKEVQLQKLVKLNVFVRLGSKEWVDYLEQKRNATRKF